MDDSMLCSLPDAECEICSHNGPALLCQGYDRCQNARCLYCVNKFTADKFMRNMPRIIFVCETCTNAPAKRDAAPKPPVKAKEAARKPLPAATWSDDELSDDDTSSDDEFLGHKQQRQKQARLKEKQKQRQAAPGKAAEAARPPKRPAAAGGEPKRQQEIGQGQRSKKPKADATAAGHGQVGSGEGPAARIASGQGASTSAPRPNSTQEAANRQQQQLPSQQLPQQKQLPDQQPQGQQQPQQPHGPEVETDMQAAQRYEAQPRLQQQREQERQAAAAPSSLRLEQPQPAQQDVDMNGQQQEQQQHEQQQPDAMRPPDPGKAPAAAKATAIKRPAASGLPTAQAAGISAAGTTAKKRPQEPADSDLQASAAAAPAKKRKLPPIKPPTAAATERSAAAGPSVASGAAAKPMAPARKPDSAAPRTKAAPPKAGAAAGKASVVPGSNAAGLKAGAAGGAAGKAGGTTGAKAAAAGEAPKRAYPVTTPTGPAARVPVVNDGIRRAAQQQAEAQRLEQQRREEKERRAAEQKQKEALARRNPLQRLTSGMEAEKEKLHQGTVEVEDDSDAEYEEEQRKLANAMMAQAAAAEVPRPPSREEAPSPRRLWEGTLFALLDPLKFHGMDVPLAAFSVPGAPGSPTNVDNIRRLPTYLSTVAVPWRAFASKIPEGHIHKPVSSVAFHEKLSFSTSVNALQPVIRRLLDSKLVLFISLNGVEWFFGLQQKSTAPMSDDRKNGDWPFGEVISHVEEHIVLLETMPDDAKQPWNAVARPTKSSLKGLGSGALADGGEPSSSGAVVGVAAGLGLAPSYVGSFGSGMMSPEDTAEPQGLQPSSFDGALAQMSAAATAQKSAAATAPGRSDFMGSDDDMDLDQPQLDEEAGDHGQHGSELAGLGDMGWDGDFDDVHSPDEPDAMVQTGGTILHSHAPIGSALGMGHMIKRSGGADGSGIGFGQGSGAQYLSSGALPSSAWPSRPGAPAPPPPPQLPMAQQRSTPAAASSPFTVPQSPLPPLPSLPPPPKPPQQQQQQPAPRLAPASMGASLQFAAGAGPSSPFNPLPVTAAPSASLGASEGDYGLTFDVGDMDPDVIRQLIAHGPNVPGAAGVAHNGINAVVAHNSASVPTTTMPGVFLGSVVPPLGPGPQDPRRLARSTAPGGPAPPRPHQGDGATRQAASAAQPISGHAVAANKPRSKSPLPRTGNGHTREHGSPQGQRSNQRNDRSHSGNQQRHNGYSRPRGDSPPHRSSNGSKPQGGGHERRGSSPQHRGSDHSRRSGSSSLPPKQHMSSGSGLPASQHRSPAQRNGDHTKRQSSNDKGARTNRSWKDRG